MATQEQIADEIEQLEELLNAGADNVSSDGESVSLNLQQIRRRLNELKAQLVGNHHQQRQVRSIDLSQAF